MHQKKSGSIALVPAGTNSQTQLVKSTLFSIHAMAFCLSPIRRRLFGRLMLAFCLMVSLSFSAQRVLAQDSADSSDSQSPSAKLTVLIMGDSLTAGYGIDPDLSYPALLQKQFTAEGLTHVRVLNAGISGSTSASAISRLRWYARQKPDILILALGANDGLRGQSVPQMKLNLAKTIELAEELNIKTLIAGMRMLPNYGRQFTEAFAKIFPELADEHQTLLIPFLLKNVAGEPQYNLSDGIHPNEKGHQIIAETVYTYLRPLL